MFFVTANKNKLRGFEEILGMKLEQIEIDLEEIQDIEVEKVVEHKALEAYEKVGKPVIVEDTGLYIEAWKGFPGALAKWVDKTIGFENIPAIAFCGVIKAFKVGCLSSTYANSDPMMLSRDSGDN